MTSTRKSSDAGRARSAFLKNGAGEIFFVFNATPDDSWKMMGISPTGVYGRAYPDPTEEVLRPASAEEVAQFKLALAELSAVERRRHDEDLPRCIEASLESFNEDANEPRST